MADNVNITSGAGTVIATEQDGSSPNEHYQKIKIVDGTPGSFTPLKVNANGGVNITAASLPLPAGASVSAKQPALGTAGTAASDVITIQGIASMTAVKVDGSAVTQPVSAASLPLPANAVQETGGHLSSLDTKQPALGQALAAASIPVVLTAAQVTTLTPPAALTNYANETGGNLATLAGAVTGGKVKVTPDALPAHQSTNVDQLAGTAVDTNSGTKSAGTLRVVLATDQPTNTNALKVDGSAVTQPVSTASLPLPSGAATSAKQPALGTAGTPAADVITVQGKTGMTAVVVDGSGVTQPVSGSVTVSGTTTARLNDGSGNSITSTSNALDVNIKSGSSSGTQYAEGNTAATATGTLAMAKNGTTLKAFQADSAGNLQVNINASTATVPISGTITANQGGTWTVQPGNVANTTAWKVDGSAVTQPVSAASLPLPSGAATSAKQPALGTAGTASSDVITVQGVASMTALKTDGSGVTQPVSGTVTANAGTGTFAVSAAALPLPAGASTAAKQPSLGTAGTPSTDVLTVQGKSGMTAVVVDGSAVTQPVSGTFWQATQPVSGTVTVQQSTAANLKVDLSGTAANSTAIKVDGSAVTQPVSIATMPSTPVTGTFWQATQPVSGTVAATQSGTWTVQPGNTANTTPWLVSGGAASGATPSGNPLRSGVLGRTTLPAAVSSGQMVDLLADRYGRVYKVAPVLSNANSAGTAVTTNTNTSIVAAPSAGNHLRVHRLWAQNSSATGTWCYWGNGSGVKTIPFFLGQNQPMMMNLGGSWELSTATALFLNTATTGANIEWYAEYETLVD